MKTFLTTLTATLLTAGVAFAQCAKPEDNLFTCTFEGGKKTVELCMNDGNPFPKISYKFGKTGQKSELTMEKSFVPMDGQKLPTEGYFVAVWEGQTVRIAQKEFRYDLEHWVDPGSETQELEEGYRLSVSKNNSTIKDMDCDRNSHTGDLGKLIDTLRAKGINTDFS